MADLQIKGLTELQKVLDELPAKIEANVLRAGMRVGAKVIEAEAKRLVPVSQPSGGNRKGYGAQMGALRDSIRVSMRSRNGQIQARIRAGNKVAWYAHLVEFGTARHTIKPKNRKSLLFAHLARELVDHPGARPKPFMRPAFDAKAQAAIEAMAEYMKQRLPREVKKFLKS